MLVDSARKRRFWGTANSRLILTSRHHTALEELPDKADLRRLFPGKSNLAIAHAAETPKMRFAGTAIAATRSVNWIAAKAAASLNVAQ
jgi:hypothetical protein